MLREEKPVRRLRPVKGASAHRPRVVWLGQTVPTSGRTPRGSGRLQGVGPPHAPLPYTLFGAHGNAAARARAGTRSARTLDAAAVRVPRGALPGGEDQRQAVG